MDCVPRDHHVDVCAEIRAFRGGDDGRGVDDGFFGSDDGGCSWGGMSGLRDQWLPLMCVV